MKISIKPLPKGTLLIILTAICIMIRSGSPYSLAYQTQTLYLHFAISIVIVLGSLMHRPAIKSGFLKGVLLLYSTVLLFVMLNTGEWGAYRNYLLQIMLFADAYFIVRYLGVSRTIKYWVYTMRVVLIASLLLLLLVNINASGLPLLDTGKRTYYTIGFASQLVSENRISGTFWEPSMYLVFLAFTLLLELMPTNKLKHYKLFATLECVALFLSGSMSAVILLLMMGYLILYHNIRRVELRAIFLSICVLLIICVSFWFDDVINYLYKLFPSVFYKFVEEDSSFLTRLYNPIGDLLTCKHSPLGAGIMNVEEISASYASEYAKIPGVILARTSTWSYYFAAYGILGGISVNAIWLVGIWRSNWMSFTQKIILMLAIFYALTSITLVSNQLYWVFLMLLYCFSREKEVFTNNRGSNIEVSNGST